MIFRPLRKGTARPCAADQRGFSLIELIVVVAIISILAMIGLPQYQLFSAKARVAGGLAEIAPGKVAVEALISEGHDFRFPGSNVFPRPSDIGLPAQGTHCKWISVPTQNPYTTDFQIMCILEQHNLRGAASLIRDRITGVWRCEVNTHNPAVVPTSCNL